MRRAEVPSAVAVLATLVAADVVLLAIELVNRWSGLLLPFFLLEAEANLPTWLSATQLAGAAAGAFLLARLSAGCSRLAWYAVAAAFVGLSLIEGTDVHNRIEDYIGNAVYGVLYLPSIAIGAPALWHAAGDLHQRFPPARALLAAGLGSIAVSVVVDAVLKDSEPSLWRSIGMVSEEWLELLGGSLLAGAVLTALAASAPPRSDG